MTAGRAQTVGSCAAGNWRLGLEINRGALRGLRYYKIAREAPRKGLRKCRIRPQQSRTTAAGAGSPCDALPCLLRLEKRGSEAAA